MSVFRIVSKHPQSRGVSIVAEGFVSREIAEVAFAAIESAFPTPAGWTTYIDEVEED
jgi:hypothetical protein